MSHFVVAVIHRADQSIPDLLAPYEEKEGNSEPYWDWYEIGGRWHHTIKRKDGKLVDATPLKELDLVRDEDAYNDALDFWDCVIDKTKEKDPKRDYFTLYKDEYYKQYYGDRKTYARYRSEFAPYAVVTPDGKWHSYGVMGWFGCSNDTPEEFREWHENFRSKFIDGQDPDLILTIVDCHI